MRKIAVLGSILAVVTALTLFWVNEKRGNPGDLVYSELKRADPVMHEKLQGQYFLLHFWAKWCEPCIDEIPDLVHFARKFTTLGSAKPLFVLAVSLDPTLEDSKQILPEKGQNLPQNFLLLLDAEQRFANRIGSFQYPETYLVGPDGQILEKWVGLQKWLEPQVFEFFLKKIR
jgi:thiol-disulfide isomerase/thioredoxin